MSATALASALGGRRTDSGWMARCPAHEDREPSLSISERRGLVLIHCHAGCTQAEVIAALRGKGLWSGSATATPVRSLSPSMSATKDKATENPRLERALNLWSASKPAGGTMVETYLSSRSIVLPPPPRLRFHPALRHPMGVFPAMIALVTRGSDNTPLGIQRTFLAKDGLGKAPISPQRMMLGPCRGGVVNLAQADRSIMIGEGVETCLSAMQATGRPAWAALSTSGLRSVILPEEIEDVVILADADPSGRRAAEVCAARLLRSGRHVQIAYPPAGMDFNDLLRNGGRSKGQ